MDETVHSTVTEYGVHNRVQAHVEHDLPPVHGMNIVSKARGRAAQEGNTPLQVIMPGRILLPVDISKCPLEVFPFINKFASDHRVTVILLHVVNLNAVVPDNRVFDALACAAGQHLKRLADRFINPELSVRLRVRVGRPAQEILAEAKESNVDLIVLTSYGCCSFWKRPFHPRIVEKVLGVAPCNATLLHVQTRFDCEEDWDCVDDIVAALKYTGLLTLPIPPPS